MNTIKVMRQACADALEESSEGYDWAPAYASLVDPLSVLEMIGHLEKLLAHAEQTDPAFAEQIKEAIHSPTRFA